MDDIQDLFKETIAEFMENGLDAELGYSKYDYPNKDTDNSRNGHSSKALHQLRRRGGSHSPSPQG